MPYAKLSSHILALVAGSILATAPALASVTHTTGTVNGFAVDIWSWNDSHKRPRTVALKMEGNGNTGHGGYAVQMTYYRAVYSTPLQRNMQLVTINAETNTSIDSSAASDSGFGYFVSHERDRYFGNDGDGNPILDTIASHIFGKDDSPLGRGFAATASIPLNTTAAGAESFLITYGHYGTVAPNGIDPDTGYDSPPLTTSTSQYQYYPMPVTTTWVFQDGMDYPRLDITVDLSQVIPSGSTTPSADLVSFDVRGPYGVMVFDNGADAALDYVSWGDQEYTFITSTPTVTRSTSWVWNSANTGARFNVLTAASTLGAYEMGLYEPILASQSALADGYAPERGYTQAQYAALVKAGDASPSYDSCSPGAVQTLPSDGEWPYQSAQYSLPCPSYGTGYLTAPAYNKKIAWGSSSYYGTSLQYVYNGQTSYPINGFPANYKLSYSVCLVTDWNSTYAPHAEPTVTQTVAGGFAPNIPLSNAASGYATACATTAVAAPSSVRPGRISAPSRVIAPSRVSHPLVPAKAGIQRGDETARYR